MHENYWGLKEKPFENTPDPRFLFSSTQHEEGLSRLLYCVRESKGAGMLTGVFGCGKTLLSRVLMRELEKDVYRVALIVNPLLKAEELLLAVASLLGTHGLPSTSGELLPNTVLAALTTVLENNAREGRRTVVIVDEAHVIQDRSVWEHLRLLLNAQWEDRFLLTLLLLGQPELKVIVQADKPLAQRIALGCHLTGLQPEETAAYILHRLKVAGRVESGPFVPETMSLIHTKSGGIPRRINQLCDLALFAGFGQQVTRIDEALVRDVSESLEGM